MILKQTKVSDQLYFHHVCAMISEPGLDQKISLDDMSGFGNSEGNLGRFPLSPMSRFCCCRSQIQNCDFDLLWLFVAMCHVEMKCICICPQGKLAAMSLSFSRVLGQQVYLGFGFHLGQRIPAILKEFWCPARTLSLL